MTTFTTGHVGLSVTDLDRSQSFYERVLGFEPIATGDDADRRWVFLGQDGDLVLTLWQQSDSAFSAVHAGLHHLSLQVDSVDDVRSVEATVRDLGAEVVHDGLVAHGEGAGSGGVFFTDPDGIRLEVFAATGLEGAPAPSGDAPTCGFF